MRYVPYTSEIEYKIIVWTIVESIPVLIATTYVRTMQNELCSAPFPFTSFADRSLSRSIVGDIAYLN